MLAPEFPIRTIDSHTGGEGTRLVVSPLPELAGASMAEKLAAARASLAWLPRLLLGEPRGHQDLYGALLTPPCHPQADQGVLFMNNRDFEPMCGHGLIGVVTSLLEAGLLEARPDAPGEMRLLIDTAAGPVAVCASLLPAARGQGVRVQRVDFDNVPCFAWRLDALLRLEDGLAAALAQCEIAPPGPGLRVDIAFGGNFFVLVQAASLGLELSPATLPKIARLGMAILQAANRQHPLRHPLQPGIERITDVRFTAPLEGLCQGGRIVVVLGEQMIDRSPCGTGACAELAVRYARRQTALQQDFTSQGILGTQFSVRALSEASLPGVCLPYPAIIPRLSGRAFVTGYHRFVLADDDPFPQGFSLVG
jgi:proline racemase